MLLLLAAVLERATLGIAMVEDLRVVDTFYSLIQPPGLLFHPGNIRVHGITPDMVAHAPTMDQLWPRIRPLFSPHCPVAAHNAAFDMRVLRRSCSAEIPDFPYVDTIPMAAPLVPGSRSLMACAVGVCASPPRPVHRSSGGRARPT